MELDPLTPFPANPWLAGCLSLFLPGAGQLYLGQRLKGGIVFAGGVVLCCGLGLWNVFAALDAFVLARRLRDGHPVGVRESWSVLDRVMSILDDLFL